MIGKLFGALCLVGSLAAVYKFESASFGSGVWRVFHPPAMLLTLLGPIGLMAISADWRSLAGALRYLFSRSQRAWRRQRKQDALFLHDVAKRYYEEGATAFETPAPPHVSAMAKKVLERLSLRIPSADIRELVDAEREHSAQRVAASLTVISLGVRLSPSVGMLGTILGMVQLLATLDDPVNIGKNMSLALFTTFYGLFFSLVVWSPLHYKLERTLAMEIQSHDEILRWLELLEKRKPADFFTEPAQLTTKVA